MIERFIVEVIDRQSTFEVDQTTLTDSVQIILAESKFSNGEISIAVVDDSEMHKMNVQFLNHDYPTDVLSFPLEKTNDFLAGEIVVSSDTAKKECGSHGLTERQELLLYVVHGTLHLVGYDDKSPADRDLMREKEAYYMNQFGIDLNGVAKAHE